MTFTVGLSLVANSEYMSITLNSIVNIIDCIKFYEYFNAYKTNL